MILKNGQDITHFCKEEIKKAQAMSSGLKEGYWLGKYVGTIEAYETLLALIEGKIEENNNPFIYTPNKEVFTSGYITDIDWLPKETITTTNNPKSVTYYWNDKGEET